MHGKRLRGTLASSTCTVNVNAKLGEGSYSRQRMCLIGH